MMIQLIKRKTFLFRETVYYAQAMDYMVLKHHLENIPRKFAQSYIKQCLMDELPDTLDNFFTVSEIQKNARQIITWVMKKEKITELQSTHTTISITNLYKVGEGLFNKPGVKIFVGSSAIEVLLINNKKEYGDFYTKTYSSLETLKSLLESIPFNTMNFVIYSCAERIDFCRLYVKTHMFKKNQGRVLAFKDIKINMHLHNNEV